MRISIDRSLLTILAAGAAAVAASLGAGCENPAAGKPKATVAEATSEPAVQQQGPTAERLVLGPERSRIEFVGSKVTGKHDGGFRAFRGQVSLVPSDLARSQVSFEIDMSSVYSDADKLTGHLKSPDFFDVARFPKATFDSTSIARRADAPDVYTITGNLDLHGVKKSISFPAAVTVSADEFSARTEFALNRKHFDINYPGMKDDLIRDEVVLKIALVAPRAGR